MGCVCQDLEGRWFVWISPLSKYTQSRLVTDMNPKGAVTINKLELAALFIQVNKFAPKMGTLAHICTSVDNTTEQGWSNRGSVRLVTAVGLILRNLALLTSTNKIYSSVQRIAFTNNNMDDAASRLTHITNKM